MTDTSDRPLVTFAVIAYNQEHCIREAIEGAFTQTYTPLEVILSDDCSPDRTFKVMEEMVAAYNGPHKLILNRNPKNLGLVPHLDRVMELTSGKFFVVSAGDDISVPQRTEKQVAAWLQSGQMVRLVHSATREVDRVGHPSGEVRRPPARVIRAPTGATFIRDRGFVIGATAAWDRKVYETFGPLGDGLSTEDRVIPFRAALLGDITYLDEPLVDHRMDGVSGHSGPLTGWDYLYGVSHKLRKWTAEIDRHVLLHFADISYPEKDEIESACRQRERRIQFIVELAEATYWQRFKMSPRALHLALQDHSILPVKQWMRYMFDRLYMPYVTWRTKLRPPRVDRNMVPDPLGRD